MYFSPLFIYMGCCEDYLTCDIAFNAVMPLSRASTRGGYSRIEGVTLDLRRASPRRPKWPEAWLGSSLLPSSLYHEEKRKKKIEEKNKKRVSERI